MGLPVLPASSLHRLHDCSRRPGQLLEPQAEQGHRKYTGRYPHARWLAACSVALVHLLMLGTDRICYLPAQLPRSRGSSGQGQQDRCGVPEGIVQDDRDWMGSMGA